MTALKIVDHVDEQLRADWLRLRDAILDALPILRGALTESELFCAVLEERVQFWADEKAFAFTKLTTFDNGLKQANIFLAGGDIEGAFRLRKQIEQWCRDNGVRQLIHTLRPGVERIMKTRDDLKDGWEHVGAVYVKDL